jgi:hypothetical protein
MYDFGGWDGTGGILTSMPDAGPTVGLTTVGMMAGDGYFNGTFGGHDVAATDVLLMYTYAGDATLDGLVDASDYGLHRQLLPIPRHRRLQQRRLQL